ncbi:hypothetical protein JMJ35_000921 [Cladonia borealis]|uniref:NACHT-NTPase and P-loop NTPases N-terminal domain-containing protein n=1 Tax=Cladonia borealis TaxID=184061 RepID=A0AA39R7K7_9LECA|nr:hypothetical protein JMJ35_000921 [Cladonia borealis]
MAEAAAVIGLVASIATLVELTAKVVSRLHEFSSKSSEVPESFRSLSTRLPLLMVTLQHIQSQAKDGRFPDDVTKTLEAVVDDTSRQVSDIQISLSKVLPSDGASKFERALKALKSLAKEDKVQRALEKIYGNNDILVLHQTTRHVDTGDRILEALSKLSVTPPTLPCPSLTIPFGRDPDFVDRGGIVDQLCRKCALPASRTVLVGLGGVGKSQLAIELGYRTREQSPGTWVLWVHAGSMARLEQSFRDVANYVEIPGRQDPKANIFRLVHDWLRDGKSKQWLLILDNVDNPDLLSEAGDAGQRGQGTGVDGERRQPISAYLPQSQNGSILVTSRSQAAALKLVEEKDIMVVQAMTPAQALTLFEKKLGSLGQGDDTAELAAALEFMPLAIVQAAAYVSQRAPRYSVQRYLEDFRKSDRKRTSLLNYEGGQLRRDWEAQNSIIITWQISFEHIRETRPSAADLLSLMSFFDRQGIPEALVRNRGANDYADREEGDRCQDGEEQKEEEEKEEGEAQEDEDSLSGCSEDDGFEDDVQLLRNYSFISVGTDRTFEMHALVQLATRKWLEANGQLEQWKQSYIHNLSAEFPNGEYENWKYCQTLFPHAKSAIIQRPKAEGSLREWASLLHNAGWYAYEKGSINEAVDLSEMAMKVRKKILGQEHRETLDSMDMVGLAYDLGGRWKEVEELQVRVIEIRNKVLGEEHPDTLNAMNNLALAYWNQARWKEAEELKVRVLEISKKVLGEEHPNTLISIANLALTYKDQGRWKEAEELGIQVLEIRKRVLGEEHPDTLMSINNLASTYWDQGRWTEAEELDLQVLEIRKRVLGEEHPNTLVSISNLASTYRDQGRWKEAEELELQVLEIRKRVLGKEHPNTLMSMNNLACTLKDKGEDEKAIALMEECVEKRKHVLSQDHPYTKKSEDWLRRWRVEALHLGSSGKDVNSTAAGE